MQLLCLSFVVMRCQPLRRALALREEIWKIQN
nr:acetyltransferase [Vibrio mimicus]